MKHISTAYEAAITWQNPIVRAAFDQYGYAPLEADWLNSECKAIWHAMDNTGDEDDPNNPGPYTSWIELY